VVAALAEADRLASRDFSHLISKISDMSNSLSLIFT
jgi:hypothetical protein